MIYSKQLENHNFMNIFRKITAIAFCIGLLLPITLVTTQETSAASTKTSDAKTLQRCIKYVNKYIKEEIKRADKYFKDFKKTKPSRAALAEAKKNSKEIIAEYIKIKRDAKELCKKAITDGSYPDDVEQDSTSKT